MNSPRPRTNTVWILSGAIWLSAAAVGLALMAVYANRPGEAAKAPAQWPLGSGLHRDAALPTLVMVAHPKCDCTRASVAELAELIARVRRPPRVFVVFIQPPGVDAETWTRTDLWSMAARIPGTTLVRDDGGVEAERFGARTSGQTLLYDVEGRLVFDGGTTGSRGHVGDNLGFSSLVDLLGGGAPTDAHTPVYGCDLFAPGERAGVTRPTSNGL
jgi:hypothetical protein